MWRDGWDLRGFIAERLSPYVGQKCHFCMEIGDMRVLASVVWLSTLRPNTTLPWNSTPVRNPSVNLGSANGARQTFSTFCRIFINSKSCFPEGIPIGKTGKGLQFRYLSPRCRFSETSVCTWRYQYQCLLALLVLALKFLKKPTPDKNLTPKQFPNFIHTL